MSEVDETCAVPGEMANPLLDLLGPVALAPAIIALFWGSGDNARVLIAASAYAVWTVAFALGLWQLSRRAPQLSELGETVWSAGSGLIASALPWIMRPETRWGHFALGFIFAVIMSNDTLFAALRPNKIWKFVLLSTAVSYGLFLTTQGHWVLGICCLIYATTLVGGHDAIQDLVHRLRRQRAQSEQLALTDPLTGLANRRGLNRFIAEAARGSKTELRVALIDIDDFKRINDRHGHMGGDVVLLGLAEHLSDALGHEWLVTRSGGDEFVCISETGSLEVACRVLSDVPSLRFEDAIVPIKVSAGLAYGPADDTILADASEALRISKQRGKQKLTVVDDELRAKFTESRRLGAQLAEALEQRDIEIWAQPIVHTADRSIYSYECLARWTTPEGQKIPPSTFIPMIEDQRLTRELGESVITQATEFAIALGGDTPVSVNISVSHFIHPSFTEFVHRTLERHGLAPSRLIIEITESEDAPSATDALRVARQLEQMGVGLSIDDFGTGYASLERILRFPCSQLKLDRTIAANIAGTGLEHLLAGFGTMSAVSGLEIVAEGIEDQIQHDLLVSLGISLAQGFFYGRPRPTRNILREHPGLAVPTALNATDEAARFQRATSSASN